MTYVRKKNLLRTDDLPTKRWNLPHEYEAAMLTDQVTRTVIHRQKLLEMENYTFVQGRKYFQKKKKIQAVSKI